MEERRLGQPKSDLERTAQHFGVPEGEVTLEMLKHVEGIPRGSGEMEMLDKKEPFDNLETIPRQLEALPEWRRLGAMGVNHDIQAFIRDFDKMLIKTRGCEDIPSRVDELIQLLPRGRKVGEEVWNMFEMLGAWTSESEKLTDRIQATLATEPLKAKFVEAVMSGCRCNGS